MILVFTLMIPYNGDTDEIGKALFSNKMWLPFNVIRGLILIIFFYNFIKNNKTVIPPNVFKLYLVFLLLSIAYVIINDNNQEIIHTVSFFIYTYLAFYIAFIEKIPFKNFLLLMRVVCYCVVFYAILEFIFHKSPYEDFYSGLVFNESIRAKGLMGHPLVLSAYLCFHQVVLYADLILNKKFRHFDFLILLVTGLMTASRTTLILYLIGFVVFILIEKSNNRITFKRSLLLIISVTILFAIVILYFNNFLVNTLDRVTSSEANQRLGAYSVIFEIFLNKPWGVGVTGLESELGSSAYTFTNLFDKDLLLIDNMYLSTVGYYGIFCPILFLLYAYPLVFSKKYVSNSKNKDLYKILLMLYVVWFFQNFSFDTNEYISINVYFFTLVAFIVKERQSNYKNFGVIDKIYKSKSFENTAKLSIQKC